MGGQWALLLSLFAAAAAAGNDDARSANSAEIKHNGAATDQSAAESNEVDVRKSSLIEEIIVTAVRDDTTLKDSAHSVVVFTEEQLQLGTDRQIVDVLQRVPNVSTRTGDRQPIIRGIAQNGIDRNSLTGAWPNNLTFVDGFFAPAEPALWDTRQVEVQRGAENFVGAGVMGGLIATLTNDPSEVREGRLVASWAPDPGDRSLGIAYGGPLTDQLRYRIAAYARSTDGFWTNPTRDDDDWNSADETLARIKLVWAPQDDSDTVVRVRAEHHKTSIDGANSTFTDDRGLDPFARKDFADAPVHYQDEALSLYGELDHRFDDLWSMSVQSTLIEEHLRGQRDLGRTAEPEGRIIDPWRDLDYAALQVRAFYDSEEWQGYVRQYILRLDLTNAHTDILLPGLRVRYSYSTPDWWLIGTQLGASRTFGRLTTTVSLLRSGQVLHAHRGVDYDPPFLPSLDVATDLNDFKYLPAATIDYALSDDLTIGAKYERSARLAGTWFNLARATVNEYDDEISDGYEAFMRWSALNSQLTLRANVFYARITNQQVGARLSDDPNDVEVINAGRSHNDGVEIETTWTDGGLNVWISVGLLQAQFDRFVLPDGDLSGNDFPNAPDWTVSFGCTYTHSIGLFIEADVTLRPEARASLENVPWSVTEERRIVNARVGWAFKQFNVSLYARNLFDDQYLGFRESDPASDSLQVYSPGDPREVGMTLTLDL